MVAEVTGPDPSAAEAWVPEVPVQEVPGPQPSTPPQPSTQDQGSGTTQGSTVDSSPTVDTWVTQESASLTAAPETLSTPKG